MMVRPLQAGVTRPSTAMHIQKVDTLGFPTVQTDWKNSTVAPSYPPGTSGNLVLKKKIFAIFWTNLRPMMVRPLQAGVTRPSTAMHIQKVDTLGFPTVQTDWKNSTVAPSYPPGTSGNLVLKKKFAIFCTNLRPMMVRPLQAGVTRPSTAMHIQKVDTLGFPTVQTDWKNSTVAPSYPPGTSGNPVLKKKFLSFF